MSRTNQIDSSAARPTGVRYGMLALLALAPACAYLVRNISAANTTIAWEFDASDSVMGDVMSGFALGYFVFQIPGGLVAISWGVRRTLAAIGLAWSLCALWCGLAQSPDELWLARVAMGVAQAGLVPCCAQGLTNWFPVARRGIASSVIAGSMQLGGIVAMALTARLLDPIGWRAAMLWYALIGGIWVVAFYLWFRNRPAEHGRVNAAELELIGGGRDATPVVAVDVAGSAAKEWRDFAMKACASAGIWAFFAQAVFRAYANEFFYNWCPAFLEKGYGLDKVDSASLSTLPVWALGIGSLVSGYVVDAVFLRTGSRWISRSGMAVFGLAVCGLCFAAATRIADARVAMVVMAVGALFSSLGGPAAWAAAMDLGGRRAAVLIGAMNMAGNIGAYYSPKQVGALFEHIETSSGSWSLVLWLMAGVYLAAAVSWIFVNPRRPLDD